MSGKDLSLLQSSLILKFDEIVQLCERSGYDVTPTLLLRHSSGSSASIMLGNDDKQEVIKCIADLFEIGNHSEQNPSEAALNLFKSMLG